MLAKTICLISIILFAGLFSFRLNGLQGLVCTPVEIQNTPVDLLTEPVFVSIDPHPLQFSK